MITLKSFTKSPRFLVVAFSVLMTVCPAFISAQEVVPAKLTGGFAVSHVDSPSAVLSFRGMASTGQSGVLLLYRMTIPKGSQGQWMGERAGLNGTRIRVGKLTAEQLVSAWGRFRYGAKEHVRSTLTWSDCCGKTQATAVHVLGKPKKTPRGVTFALKSDKPLALNLKNVSLHLIRAGQSPNIFSTNAGMTASSKSTITTMPSTQITTIVDTLTLSQYNATSSQVKVSLYDANASAPPCWSADADNVPGMNVDQYYWRVDPITCAGVTTMNADGSPAGEPWGALLDRDGSSQTARVTVSLVITPPGAYPYTYTHQFDPWSY